jgi:hypothetical protein
VKYGWDMENPSTAGLYELVVRRHVKWFFWHKGNKKFCLQNIKSNFATNYV